MSKVVVVSEFEGRCSSKSDFECVVVVEGEKAALVVFSGFKYLRERTVGNSLVLSVNDSHGIFPLAVDCKVENCDAKPISEM